jgi:hypothetical protein
MNPAAGPPMLHEPHRPCDGQFAWIPTNRPTNDSDVPSTANGLAARLDEEPSLDNS